MRKDKNPRKKNREDEMLAKYDFSGGIRGKHQASYEKDHPVTIQRADGTG